jgi:hypothetical protein
MTEIEVTHTYLHDLTGKQRTRLFLALDAANVPWTWEQDFRRLIVPATHTETLVSITRNFK